MHLSLPAVAREGRRRSGPVVALLALCCALGSGCASWTNPVNQGVPVRRLSSEYLANPKDEARTISLSLLSRQKPDVYRLAAGDVLGVYVEGVLGDKTQPIPVTLETRGVNLPPALGYPVPVLENGTISLPLTKGPIDVRGMTVPEVTEKLIGLYTGQDPKGQKIFEPGQQRILVSLLRPRQIQVLVVRQDAGGNVLPAVAAGGVVGTYRRGTGQVVDLPAGENDVLNALTRTGGLPGFDAVNEVIIERGFKGPGAGGQAFPPNCPIPSGPTGTGTGLGGQVIRIPLRLREGEPPPFGPEDVVLQNGDIVFIEARDTEVYYTGGLLAPRQFVLPRDYDLRVLDAVALAGGPLFNGNVVQNNLSGTINASGLGSPSPSRASIIRRTKHRGQVVIIVDLNRASNDLRENIIMQPGDVLIMQESLGESLTRYITTVLRFNLLANLIRQTDLLFTANGNFP
jgi:protein involved in polysaccharide export with SLBB domain